MARKETSRHIRQTGDYCFTYSPFHRPIAEVRPGEKVVVHTIDAFGNKLKSPRDRATELCHFPFVNPQTGPIFVRDAAPGDTLAVTVHRIDPDRDYAVTALIPQFGALTGTRATATLNDALPEQTRILPIRKGQVHFGRRIRIPYRPFMGTMGVAPQIEAINCLTPSYYGGNMDCVETCPGHEVQFPVLVEGAHFFTGDAHATQGDGEITGVACELAARVTLSFRVIKGQAIRWPRILSRDFIMVAGSARPLDDALRIACVELIDWMAEDYGFDRLEAYHLLGQVVQIRVGNMVDPNYTVVAKMPRKYLNRRGRA
ncbi:MAG: acetamidase/formamidase family protein [Planctomycetes bacterium]|nr:acetamidase/formamidase family protein [Planctomycetota bacterium]